MKKTISFILMVVLIVSIIPVSVITAANFSDVPQNAVYKDDLDFITNDSRHILEGYKGKFNPEDGLSVAQFIKAVVAASNAKVRAIKNNEKWYMPYIDKAIELGYVVKGEIVNYERDISRGEVARIVVRAVEKISEKPKYRDPEKVKFLIKDYESISPDLKEYVIKAYDAGLIDGYGGGTFGADNKFTRAQAVTVLRRMLDPSKRAVINIDNFTNQFTKSYDGISFNIYSDITGKNNVMKLDKAEKFAMKYYSSLVFYLKEGKPYIKGYIPKVPVGFDFYTGIELNPGKKSYLYSTSATKSKYLLPYQGNFDFKITDSLTRKDIKEIIVSVSIYTTDGEMAKYADGIFKLYYPENKLRKIDSNQTTVYLTFPKTAFEKW